MRQSRVPDEQLSIGSATSATTTSNTAGTDDRLHAGSPEPSRRMDERDARDDQQAAPDEPPFERFVEHEDTYGHCDHRDDVGDE